MKTHLDFDTKEKMTNKKLKVLAAVFQFQEHNENLTQLMVSINLLFPSNNRHGWRNLVLCEEQRPLQCHSFHFAQSLFLQQ